MSQAVMQQAMDTLNNLPLGKEWHQSKVDMRDEAIAALRVELTRVKIKWSEDYSLLDEVCRKHIALEAAAKSTLAALERYKQKRLDDRFDEQIKQLKEAGITNE